MQIHKIMGILNATPDSFSDGNSNVNTDTLIAKAKMFIDDGADIIDIGGETTKPGADDVSVEVELDRVLPVLKGIRSIAPSIQISIDTRKAEVAEETLKNGADIINDVSGLRYSPEIVDIVARHNKALVIMHSKASPKNMQLNPQYEDVVQEVFNFLQQQITLARNAGINTIIGDIGIGFAKTTNHNLTLLKHLDAFDALGVDMLLGISRKRFIGEIIDEPVPSERDAATMLFHYAMLNNRSTKYLRVHNVKLARQMLSVYSEMVGSRRCHSI